MKNFETALFKNENLAVAMKVYRCLKLDIARNDVSKQHFGNNVPRFIAFNAKGQRVDEVVLKGYKSKSTPLMKVLVSAARGHGKMPLGTFVKKYRSFLNDLDKLEARKVALSQKKSRAGKHKGKLKKLASEEQDLTRDDRALLAREKKLLESVKAFTPETRAMKVAAR